MTGSLVAWSFSSFSHSEGDRSERLCSDIIGLYSGAEILSESSSELELSKGKRFAYCRGVYTAPAIEVAAKYAQRFDHEGSEYQLVFQNRVSVYDLKVMDSPFGEYWVQPQQTLLRPYGICIRRI